MLFLYTPKDTAISMVYLQHGLTRPLHSTLFPLPCLTQVALYASSAAALGLSALACGATVIFTPGWTAVACGAGVLRSFGHLQILSFTRYLAADMPEPYKVGSLQGYRRGWVLKYTRAYYSIWNSAILPF
jgi:hypothetical protein